MAAGDPKLDVAALESVSGGEDDDGVCHDLERDEAAKVVRPRVQDACSDSYYQNTTECLDGFL